MPGQSVMCMRSCRVYICTFCMNHQSMTTCRAFRAGLYSATTAPNNYLWWAPIIKRSCQVHICRLQLLYHANSSQHLEWALLISSLRMD